MLVRTIRAIACVAVGASLSAACGSHHDGGGDQGGQSENGGGVIGTGGGGGRVTPHSDLPWIVRGQWSVDVGDGSAAPAPETAFAVADYNRDGPQQTIQANVAQTVTFTVVNDNFKTPTPMGVASYGSLDVSALSDNALYVCGTSGTDRCQAAMIRIFTRGTPGPGLWNTTENYGLPIVSGANVIGLDQAGAYVVAQISIAGVHTVNLSDFTSGARLQIPVSVDFKNAAAGRYKSTLIVEYSMQ